MEDKTAQADLSNFVETTPRDGVSDGAKADAVIPNGKPGGSPVCSERERGEGDPSTSRLRRSAQDDADLKKGDGSACAGEPDGEPALPAPAHMRYGAAGARFAARSARAADEAEALYASWTAEAKELAKDYPGFDLAAVAKEPAFARLLRGGAGLRAAYEATHMDSVRSAIRAAAAAEAEARTLDGVRLRGLRPDENGASGGGAVLTGGMAGLSRAERARIAERAMRGLL